MSMVPYSDAAEEQAEPGGMADETGEAWQLDDADFLAVLKAERAAAVGMDNNSSELTEDREKALEYYKGEMDDVPSLEGRSKAVSSDIADAVETVLPDLLEIFIGGEDVATFQPHGPEDEKAAEQETDYVNHVVFQQNPGFLNFYTVFKDALLSKVGVFKFWTEDCDKDEELALEGKTALEIQMAINDGWEVKSSKPSLTQPYAPPQPAGLVATTAMTPPVGPLGAPPGQMTPPPMGMTGPMGPPPPEPLIDVVLIKRKRDSRVKIAAVAPEHFAVAKDTVAGKLSDATYCCMRSHPRAQELLADGYDPDDVAMLPAWNGGTEESTQTARDTAGEVERVGSESTSDMRQVEIVEHFVMLLNEQTNKLELWRGVTGHGETVLLERERAAAIPFAAVTPYIQTHRFYGRSLADLLIEVQKIRTVLLRMLLDSGYFALNQRMEIAADQCSDSTVEDYLDNKPNRPVMSKTGNALRAITSGGLGFDAMAALEFMSTQAEQRTGVVRNAQGLNPDTLHDTAAGAKALIGAAQKRVRLMARIFAEIGVKPMFLGVHNLLRQSPAQPAVVRLRGEWVDVDPTAWGVRDDMEIRVGMGSDGKDEAKMAAAAAMAAQTQITQAQGGPNGPIVDLKTLYAAAKKVLEVNGIKNPEVFLHDPAPALAAEAAKPPTPPPPTPEMAKAQAQIQAAAQKAKFEEQLAQQQAQYDHQAALAKITAESELARYKADLQAKLQHDQMQFEADLKVREMAFTSQIGQPPQNTQFGGQIG